jgi:hypothetical protein
MSKKGLLHVARVRDEAKSSLILFFICQGRLGIQVGSCQQERGQGF